MNGWRRWVPGLQVLGQYEAAWFPRDLMAGLVLTAMLVPVGIAYAVASGVPGIYGLYATIVPLLTYAVFGPSRILVLGPDSALAPLILALFMPHVPLRGFGGKAHGQHGTDGDDLDRELSVTTAMGTAEAEAATR